MTTEIEIAGERAVALWIAVADDPERAETLVREIVSAECIVEATDKRVSSDIIERLRLIPGDTYHL